MIKVGDRVIVISYDWSGIVVEIDAEDAPEIVVVCVEMDRPEEFAVKKRLISLEELRRGTYSGKKPNIKIWADINDVRKIGGSVEPDWKDIWDTGAT